MSIFMIRIQLATPSSGGDYSKLHEIMENAGASRNIVADDGQVYDLPQAEYHLSSELNILEIRDRVVGYAKRVDTNPKVLITEAASFAWFLKPSA